VHIIVTTIATTAATTIAKAKVVISLWIEFDLLIDSDYVHFTFELLFNFISTRLRFNIVLYFALENLFCGKSFFFNKF